MPPILLINTGEDINVLDSIYKGTPIGLLLVLTRPIPMIGIHEYLSIFLFESLSAFDDDELSQTVFKVTSYILGIDTISVSESFSATVFAPGDLLSFSVSDSVGLSEDVSLISPTIVNISVFDSLTVSDHEPSQTIFTIISYISLSDTLSITEDIHTELLSLISVNDTITVSDFINLGIGVDDTLSETIYVSEDVSILIPIYYVSVSESITVTEYISTVGYSSLSVFEEISVNEAVVAVNVNNEDLYDSVSITEQVLITLVSKVSVYDAVLSYENFNSSSIIQASVFDSISVSENIEPYIFFELLANDNVLVVDQPILDGIIVLLSTFEPVDVNDRITVIEESDTMLYSDVSVQDVIILQLISFPFVYDQITASEEVSTSNETYSPQIPQYRPRGYKMVMDNFQYGGGVRIGGY